MLIPRSKSAFQMLTVEHYVGTEALAYALADMPDAVEMLWEAMVSKDIEAARLAMDTGFYTYYLTWEDSSTQNYSPRQYDRYIAPEINHGARCSRRTACITSSMPAATYARSFLR